jgi:3-oxoacyl-[acyl-carrier protein] reductase
MSTIPAPLARKVALVTGGSRGIGKGIAVHFAIKGIAKLAITYATNAAAAEDTLAQVRQFNPDIKAVAFKADVLSPTFGRDVAQKTLTELSTDVIDIVVNNAPYANAAEVLPVATMTKEIFDKFMTGNAWAPLQLFLATQPHIPKGGRVILIGSVNSKQSAPDPLVGYAASKAAMDSFTRSLAFQFSAQHGITINSVSVGPTVTDLVKDAMAAGQLPEEVVNFLISRNTAGRRMAEVDDIAGIVGFLASDESRWINGEMPTARHM